MEGVGSIVVVVRNKDSDRVLPRISISSSDAELRAQNRGKDTIDRATARSTVGIPETAGR